MGFVPVEMGGLLFMPHPPWGCGADWELDWLVDVDLQTKSFWLLLLKIGRAILRQL